MNKKDSSNGGKPTRDGQQPRTYTCDLLVIYLLQGHIKLLNAAQNALDIMGAFS